MKSAAFGGSKKNYLGACEAQMVLKNFRRLIRIPNMCLVFKLENGMAVSLANEQTDKATQYSISAVIRSITKIYIVTRFWI